MTFTGTTTFRDDDSSEDSTLTCSGTFPGTVVITKDSSSSSDFTLSSGCSISLGADPTTTGAGQTTPFTFNGTVTISSGTWTLVDARVSFPSGSTLTHNGTAISTDLNFTMNGTFGGTYSGTATFRDDTNGEDSTLTCSGTFPGTVVITKNNSGSSDFTLSSGCSISLGADPTTTGAGQTIPFTFNGTVTISSGTWTLVDAPVSFPSGSTLTHNGTAISADLNFTMNGTFGGTYSGTATFRDDTNGEDSTLTCGTMAGNVVIIKDSGSSSSFGFGNSCTIIGNFTRTDGPVDSPASARTISLQGNFSSSTTDAFGGANLTVEFSGSSAQTITQNAIPTTNTSLFAVNKSSNTVTLATAVTLGSTLTITAGTLDQGASFNLTTGAITVSSGATLSNTGTGDLLLSGNVSNSGTITMNGNGSSCPQTDDILIDSTVNGTQRTWSGSGAFTLIDVTVNDMAGTMTAYSSTDNGNNAWTFVSGCPLPSGTIIRGGVKVKGGVKFK